MIRTHNGNELCICGKNVFPHSILSLPVLEVGIQVGIASIRVVVVVETESTNGDGHFTRSNGSSDCPNPLPSANCNERIFDG